MRKILSLIVLVVLNLLLSSCLSRQIDFRPPPDPVFVATDSSCKTIVRLSDAGNDPYYRVVSSYDPDPSSSCVQTGMYYVNNSASVAMNLIGKRPTGATESDCKQTGVPAFAFIGDRNQCNKTNARALSPWVRGQSDQEAYLTRQSATKTTIQATNLQQDIESAGKVLGYVYAPGAAAATTLGGAVAQAGALLQTINQQMSDFDQCEGAYTLTPFLSNAQNPQAVMREFPLQEKLSRSYLLFSQSVRDGQFGKVIVTSELCPSLLLGPSDDVDHTRLENLLAKTIGKDGAELRQTLGDKNLAASAQLAGTKDQVLLLCANTRTDLEAQGLNTLDRAVFLYKLLNQTAWCQNVRDLKVNGDEKYDVYGTCIFPPERNTLMALIPDYAQPCFRDQHLTIDRLFYALHRATIDIESPDTESIRLSAASKKLEPFQPKAGDAKKWSELINDNFKSTTVACVARDNITDKKVMLVFKDGKSTDKGALEFELDNPYATKVKDVSQTTFADGMEIVKQNGAPWLTINDGCKNLLSQ